MMILVGEKTTNNCIKGEEEIKEEGGERELEEVRNSLDIYIYINSRVQSKVS